MLLIFSFADNIFSVVGAQTRSLTPFRMIAPFSLCGHRGALPGRVDETRPAGSEAVPSPGEQVFDSSVTAKALVQSLLKMVARDPSDPFNTGSGVLFVKSLFTRSRPTHSAANRPMANPTPKTN
jgi:hypothetical protein